MSLKEGLSRTVCGTASIAASCAADRTGAMHAANIADMLSLDMSRTQANCRRALGLLPTRPRCAGGPPSASCVPCRASRERVGIGRYR